MSTARAAALAFLTAFVTLFTQVLVHRVVSAKLVNNYAFLVIALTMLGFAFSGVILSRSLPALLARWNEAAAAAGALFVLSLLGACAVFYRAPFAEAMLISRAGYMRDFLRTMPLALLFAVPFAFCGLILGALLSAPRIDARRVYFWDLLGSALGAFAVIPAISRWGAEASVLGGAALLLGGTSLLFRPRRLPGRGLAALAALAIAVAALAPGRVFALRYPAGSYLSATRDPASGVVLEYVAWDPVARIEVTRIPVPDPRTAFYPALLGTRPELHRRIQRILTQNNNAFTYAFAYDGTPESLRGTEETIYAAAYEAAAAPRPKSLVIGVGGGFDVLTALYYDASSVTGIEVNAATLDILTRVYRDYFGPWVRDPRVRLVYGDGRHVLARSPERYDVIQLSGVDSASGTPAAAHVFSESYLYTGEAFDVFLAHLTEAGILNVVRPEHFPPREALRVVTTAVGALRRAGAQRPADHVVTLTTPSGHLTATLVKRTPFTPAEVERLARWSSPSPFFRISYAPGPAGRPGNVYQAFLASADPRREQAFLAAYPFQIVPVDDDRPFFFRYSCWSHLFSRDPLVLGTVPVMETAVTLLTALIGAAVAFGVWLPLRLLEGRGLRQPQAGRYGLFCAGIGLGYLAVEIALIQKFGLVLGHPNYALSVVLAALLLTTGLGSLYSRMLLSAFSNMRFVAFALAAVVLGEYFLALPRLGDLVGLPFALRVAIVFALVTPIGLCLGVFFPSALEQLKARSPAFVPWAWGLNGMFSVLAPVWAVAVSMTWGMSALLVGSLPVYLLASLALPEPEPAPRSLAVDLVV